MKKPNHIKVLTLLLSHAKLLICSVLLFFAALSSVQAQEEEGGDNPPIDEMANYIALDSMDSVVYVSDYEPIEVLTVTAAATDANSALGVSPLKIGQKYTVDLDYKNNNPDEVFLGKPEPNCICIEMNIPTKKILPGETVKLKAVLFPTTPGAKRVIVKIPIFVKGGISYVKFYPIDYDAK